MLEPRLFKATTVQFNKSKRGWDDTIKELHEQRLEYARSSSNQIDLAKYQGASDDDEMAPDNIEPSTPTQDPQQLSTSRELTDPSIDEQMGPAEHSKEQTNSIGQLDQLSNAIGSTTQQTPSPFPQTAEPQ